METLLKKEFDKLNQKKPDEGDVECVLQWLFYFIYNFMSIKLN